MKDGKGIEDGERKALHSLRIETRKDARKEVAERVGQGR